MNTQRNLLHRLVKLYPVKIIKDHFNVSIDDVINKPEATVKKFCFDSLGSTKQHIYIFSLEKKFNVGNFDEATFPINISDKNNDKTSYSYVGYNLIEFTVTLIEPYEQKAIKFYQPITVNFINKHLIIQITMIEKNISSYFNGRIVVKAIRDISEEQIVQDIRTFLDPEYNTRICDINKGIKALWAADLIDSRHVKWKKNKSTATEVMDENFTVKQQYPDVYKELIKTPLNKTVFKYLKDDEIFMDHFTTEPTYGELSIPIFPKTPNQVKNVITQILSNN